MILENGIDYGPVDLTPSRVLTEEQLFDIAYPPGTVPTSDVPTFRTTSWAPAPETIPWWVWLLVALGAATLLKTGKR